MRMDDLTGVRILILKNLPATPTPDLERAFLALVPRKFLKPNHQPKAPLADPYPELLGPDPIEPMSNLTVGGFMQNEKQAPPRVQIK